MMASSTVRAMQYYHLSRKAAILIVSIVLAKSGLSLDDIGLYETLMYLGMLFGFFWVESLIKGYLSLYNDWSDKQQASSIFSIYLLFAVLSLILGSAFYLSRDLFLPFLTGHQTLQFFAPFLIYLILYQPTALTPYVLQMKGKIGSILTYSTVHTLLLIGAVVIPLLLGMGLKGAVNGLIIFAAVMHVVSLAILSSQWKSQLSTKLMRTLLLVSAPIVLYSVIQSFSGIFDAWLVSFTFGDKSSFAIFRFGARELPLVVPLVVGVSNLAIPMMSANLNSGLEMVKKESRRLIIFLLPMGAFIMLISHWAFRVVYNPEFVESADIFNIYLLIILSQVLFPQTIFLAKKDNAILVRIAVVEVATNIILSFILVEHYGMLGIAFATFIAFATEKIVLIFLARVRHGISPAQYIPLSIFGVSAILYLLVFVLSVYQNGSI
jgi:O-antigen/teichoic acid export membrane protein